MSACDRSVVSFGAGIPSAVAQVALAPTCPTVITTPVTSAFQPEERDLLAPHLPAWRDAVFTGQAPSMPEIGDSRLERKVADLFDEARLWLDRLHFLVWNNNGYQEIERFMVDNGITPEGVKPSAPDFVQVASAYGMPAERIEGTKSLAAAIERARDAGSAYLIDMIVD